MSTQATKKGSINITGDNEDIEELTDEGLEALLMEGQDLSGNILEAIEQKDYETALKKLERKREIDLMVDGEVANATLMQFAQAYAGLHNWAEARNYGHAAITQMARQISALEEKNRTTEGLNGVEMINLDSLRKMSKHYAGVILTYEDYILRISALKKTLENKLKPDQPIEDITSAFRYKLALYSLPKGVRGLLWSFVKELTPNIEDKRTLNQLWEIVFAYTTICFTEIDPENENFLIDICLECAGEKNYNKSRASTTKNRSAAEERIKNRANKILARNAEFISEHAALFEALKTTLAAYPNLMEEKRTSGELGTLLQQHLKLSRITLSD